MSVQCNWSTPNGDDRSYLTCQRERGHTGLHIDFRAEYREKHPLLHPTPFDLAREWFPGWLVDSVLTQFCRRFYGIRDEVQP